MKVQSLSFTFLMALLLTAQVTFADCNYEQSIQGENMQIGTMLTWTTSLESNNAMFLVEKSVDGAEFINIGNVKGAGDSDDLREYNFLDVMAGGDKTFYRLKQVDFDGAFSYSDIVTIRAEFQNNFMVARMSAVATTGQFDLTIDAMADGVLKYMLANWKEETILERDMILINGLNELSVDLTDQKAGIYKLSLNMDEEEEVLVLRKVLSELDKKPNMASTKKNSDLNGKN